MKEPHQWCYAEGTLQYSSDPLKLILQVDSGLADFYRSTIPKYFHVKPPMFEPHISVIRNPTVPLNMKVWEKYQGKLMSFRYDTYIYNDELYYWLNVLSLDLESVRKELGMQPYGDVTRSPDGQHLYHITLGNLKK